MKVGQAVSFLPTRRTYQHWRLRFVRRPALPREGRQDDTGSLETPLSVPLVIIGGGPDQGQLQAQAEREGLTQVQFKGQLPRNETLAAINSARFAIISSEGYETFCMAIADLRPQHSGRAYAWEPCKNWSRINEPDFISLRPTREIWRAKWNGRGLIPKNCTPWESQPGAEYESEVHGGEKLSAIDGNLPTSGAQLRERCALMRIEKSLYAFLIHAFPIHAGPLHVA